MTKLKFFFFIQMKLSILYAEKTSDLRLFQLTISVLVLSY